MVLHYYGEHEAPEEMERALAADPELARRYAALKQELGALQAVEAPEPRPGLEGRMWARVAPDLTPPRRRFGFLFLVGALAAVALAAFLAGRSTRPAPDDRSVAQEIRALPPEARERVLQAALADHLESSQRFMLEVVNDPQAMGDERAWAEALLSANRLYRRAAERAGQRRVAAVLLELEPVLSDLAGASRTGDVQGARTEIQKRDLLFKVRITRNNLKEMS